MVDREIKQACSRPRVDENRDKGENGLQPIELTYNDYSSNECQKTRAERHKH